MAEEDSRNSHSVLWFICKMAAVAVVAFGAGWTLHKEVAGDCPSKLAKAEKELVGVKNGLLKWPRGDPNCRAELADCQAKLTEAAHDRDRLKKEFADCPPRPGAPCPELPEIKIGSSGDVKLVKGQEKAYSFRAVKNQGLIFRPDPSEELGVELRILDPKGKALVSASAFGRGQGRYPFASQESGCGEIRLKGNSGAGTLRFTLSEH